MADWFFAFLGALVDVIEPQDLKTILSERAREIYKGILPGKGKCAVFYA